MNRDELADLLALPVTRQMLGAADLAGPDRTLALGYTSAKDTWHLYLRRKELHVLIYDGLTDRVVSHSRDVSWPIAELVPDKRLYPESLDVQFGRLMRERGQDLRLRNFDEARHRRVASQRFHGLTWDDNAYALRHPEDHSTFDPAPQPPGDRYDLIDNRVPDGETVSTLYLNGVAITAGLHVHHVDPGSSGCGHGWLTAVTTVADSTPTAVVHELTRAAREYHGACDAMCEQDQDWDQ